MELQTTKNNQLAVQSTLPTLSQKLINSLVLLEIPDRKDEAKLELISVTRELMPGGKPTFLEVVKYPMISDLVISQGETTMLKIMFLLVKDFCNSVNVVRNMNDDQMIEAASMLLDECGNFRLEDYVMMFTMAKRGGLGKIYDRIDLEVISNVMDQYWSKRKAVAEVFMETEINHYDSLGPTSKSAEEMHPLDQKLISLTDKMAGAFEGLKEVVREEKNK
jgi:hypothetical protein